MTVTLPRAIATLDPDDRAGVSAVRAGRCPHCKAACRVFGLVLIERASTERRALRCYYCRRAGQGVTVRTYEIDTRDIVTIEDPPGAVRIVRADDTVLDVY